MALQTLYLVLSLVFSSTDSSNFSWSFLECNPFLVPSPGHLIHTSFRFRYIMSGIAGLLAITQLSIFWIGQVPFSHQGSPTLPLSKSNKHVCIFKISLLRWASQALLLVFGSLTSYLWSTTLQYQLRSWCCQPRSVDSGLNCIVHVHCAGCGYFSTLLQWNCCWGYRCLSWSQKWLKIVHISN